MAKGKRLDFETRAIHEAGADPLTGAVMTPVYLSSTFRQDSVDKNRGYDYSRSGNPTRDALEKSVASLENARFGLAFSSGLGAEMVCLSLLKSGGHIVAVDNVYGGTFRLLETFKRQFGIDYSLADLTEPESLEKALKPNTGMVYLESPTNPLLKLVDIAEISRLAHKKGLIVAVDNTFLSPVFQNPLDLGADIVIHSTTKYINGHSDIIGGAIACNDEKIYRQLKFLQNAFGPTPSPLDCFLVLRGIKTLKQRMLQHEKNAQAIAEFLERHPKVKRVIYPGLKSFAQKGLAQKQMKGTGGIITIELKGNAAAAKKFLAATNLFTLGVSLGGVESLIEYPWAMTHGALPESERRKAGITETMVRLSVGLESADDLVEDLKQALEKA
ncbi:MAG: PLP-dependent transferase [Candidatus Diapherotrites archaeon]|nr:PLP-dependent transferase [Candidatus Diapherotrites archaeon]